MPREKMVNIPSELNLFFKDKNFENYPIISIPQLFIDKRGEIKNLVDGTIGDVAVITSHKNTIRANHYHKTDWHFIFLLSGYMTYSWKNSLENKDKHEIQVKSNSLLYTPPLTPHKLFFLKDSVFLSISLKSRLSNKYDEDTVKVDI